MFADKALEILERESPYGEPLVNHCLRLNDLTVALAEQRGEQLDRDLVLAACYLHDIGLCVTDPAERNYLRRGQRFAARATAVWDMDDEQRRTLDDVLLYSHSLKEVPGISPQAELVRLAVSVEHSLGKITHGLSRGVVREVFARHPRKGFARVLLSFFRTAVLEDGPAELLRIFFPAGGWHRAV